MKVNGQPLNGDNSAATGYDPAQTALGDSGKHPAAHSPGPRRRRAQRSRPLAEPAADNTINEHAQLSDLEEVRGLVQIQESMGFLRTSGYSPSSGDVHISQTIVRRFGLRYGDAVVGRAASALPSERPRHQKYRPLTTVESINGIPVPHMQTRREFSRLTPLYPNKRLRLESSTQELTARAIDLIMPIGKGQRALIQSPPKAGKTTVLQNIAKAITLNSPECHLMIVLVDERPEEVTDWSRSVKGEVVASTFDRPPSEHTSVAELAIERAKRLAELGEDVVVLLDSITRLGRAYNNASSGSGRILSGGIDASALYPPKRFLGAARNIEEGGSLTVIATALVETGSQGDTVIFEEFKGTANADMKLDRRIAERRMFPAIDLAPSSTRKDYLIMSPKEADAVHDLRDVLSGLDSSQAIDLLMSRLRKTSSNAEFLEHVKISKASPS